MQADLALFNGNIHTMDPERPRVSAVAIAGDRFAATGSDSDMRSLVAPGGSEVDLRGATVVPGFIDAHIHFLSYGMSLREIDLSGAATLSSALERVGRRAVETQPGPWLTGRGWDQSVWEGGAFPSATQLDAVVGEHPVYLARKCGHAAWVNSLALERVGITAETEDPDGGEIVRDGEGRPTGILLERAMELAFPCMAEPADEEAVAAVRQAQEVVNRMGIVGVHTKEAAASLRAFQQLRAKGRSHAAHGGADPGGRAGQRDPAGAADGAWR